MNKLNGPTRVRGLSVRDIRFPTSLESDGSDAIVSVQYLKGNRGYGKSVKVIHGRGGT